MRSTSALCAALAVALSGCGGEPAVPFRGQSRDRIINGVAEPGHWYAVMVGDQNGGYCSGTLISRRTVITAGHCIDVTNRPTRVFFMTGTPLLQTAVVVSASLRHPGYNDTTLTNDLALLQLASDAPVQPAVLLRETLNQSFIGPKFTFVGYGETLLNQGDFGDRRAVSFPIQAVGPASISLPPNAPASATDTIDGTQFYYQVLNRNTCTGDSGGPGFVVRNGVERHAGVTSFGDDQCAYDGVVARTDGATMAWIQSTIDSFEPTEPCKADGTCVGSCVSTSPAPTGTLLDPDCADQHCGADGICVLSCSPVDPDCASLNINNCAANGICQLGCAVADPDCAGLDAGTGGGAGGGAGGSGGGAGGGSGGTTGSLKAASPALGPPAGCGCGASGGAGGLLALAAMLLRKRRAR